PTPRGPTRSSRPPRRRSRAGGRREHRRAVFHPPLPPRTPSRGPRGPRPRPSAPRPSAGVLERKRGRREGAEPDREHAASALLAAAHQGGEGVHPRLVRGPVRAHHPRQQRLAEAGGRRALAPRRRADRRRLRRIRSAACLARSARARPPPARERAHRRRPDPAPSGRRILPLADPSGDDDLLGTRPGRPHRRPRPRRAIPRRSRRRLEAAHRLRPGDFLARLPLRSRRPPARRGQRNPLAAAPASLARLFLLAPIRRSSPMQKTILILSVVALVAACAHEEIAQNPDKDWEHGLDADLSSSIAPLGPIDSDQGAYNLIRRREKEHSLGSRLTAVELDEIVNNSSQVLASALALPLFKAGVY